MAKKRYYYDCGLPFHKTLALNLDDQIDRVQNQKKASMIIFDGGVGEGKTTLMSHCADYINGAYKYDSEKDLYIYCEQKVIDFKIQLSMGGREFSAKLKLCYKFDKVVVIYDEAGDFSSRGALTRLNALLNRIFETFRAFKIIVLLGLPSFHVLDNGLMDKAIPQMLIHCCNRNNKYGNYKGYSLYRMYYIKNKMKKLIVKRNAYSFTKPNFHGHFLDLPKHRADELDRISTQGKLDILEDAEIKFEGLVSYEDIGKSLNRSIIWVKILVSKLNIPHKKLIKRKKYFDKGVIDVLMDEVERQRESKLR